MVAAGKHIVRVRHKSTVFNLYTLGDIHLGNRGYSIDRFKHDVNIIKHDPNGMVILMGDLADYIAPADKRWDPTNLPEEVRAKDLADWGGFLVRLTVKSLAPIKHKIIGALYGNHEVTFSSRQSEQCHNAVCHALGVPNWGYSCFFDICFHRYDAGENKGPIRRYRIYAHHGAGAAQSAGGKLNRLVSFMLMAEADVYLVGHVHEKDIKRVDTLAADHLCQTLTVKKKIGIFTGTYLKTYTEGIEAGYGEQKGYRPVPLGCSVVSFQPFGKGWVFRKEDSIRAVVAI